VSKEVYKYIAGYEVEADGGEVFAQRASSTFLELRSSPSPAARTKPPTLLIDSDARNIPAKSTSSSRKYRARNRGVPPCVSHPASGAQRQRHRGHGNPARSGQYRRQDCRLGAHVRCVVSVSMPPRLGREHGHSHRGAARVWLSTPGASRSGGAARREYLPNPKTAHFRPNTSHHRRAVQAVNPAPPNMLSRGYNRCDGRSPKSGKYESHFQPRRLPCLTLDAHHGAELKRLRISELDLHQNTGEGQCCRQSVGPEKRFSTWIRRSTARAGSGVLDRAAVLRYRFRDEEGAPTGAIRIATSHRSDCWRRKSGSSGETDSRTATSVISGKAKRSPANIARAPIDRAMRSARPHHGRPVLNHYNSEGSSATCPGARANPSADEEKPRQRGGRRHAVLEQLAAKALDELDCIDAYVKNAYLNFTIPFVRTARTGSTTRISSRACNSPTRAK